MSRGLALQLADLKVHLSEEQLRGHWDNLRHAHDEREGMRPPRGTKRRRGRPRKGVSLIFPPEFRLRQEDWSELAFRSQLCISPDGDSPNTGRLVEVIMHGCVPFIISDRLQPPAHEFLDWSKFAFFLREENLPDLPRILREDLSSPEGAQLIEQKHQNLAQVAHLFDYNREGVSSLLMLHLRERTRQFSTDGAFVRH